VVIEKSHEIIDRIERDAHVMLGIFLVIHMDPIETKDVQVLAAKKITEDILASMDSSLSIHDFRMVDGEKQINLIFDMIIPYQYDKEKEKEICKKLRKELQAVDDRYRCVITVEKSYIAGKEV